MRHTLVLEYNLRAMRIGVLTFTCAIFALLLATSSAVAEDETTEDESNVIIDVVLPVSLAFIMFSLGIGLTLDDFTLVIKEPKVFGIGIANQMIVLRIWFYSRSCLSSINNPIGTIHKFCTFRS